MEEKQGGRGRGKGEGRERKGRGPIRLIAQGPQTRKYGPGSFNDSTSKRVLDLLG